MFFDKSLELDPDIAFHGTSSCFESRIDAEGLVPNRTTEWKEALTRLVGVFRTLDWYGITGASRAVLEPFSLNHDHGDTRGKPIYLAESSDRASTFAQRDFAGGENARALRASFAELRTFVDDESLREAHIQKVARAHQRHGVPPGQAMDMARAPLSKANLDHARSEIDALKDVELEVRAFFDAHRYGLIYAVQLPVSRSDFEYHGSMGLKCFVALASESLVDKVVVPIDFGTHYGQDDCRLTKFQLSCERFGKEKQPP